jgi:hypothetical protein
MEIVYTISEQKELKPIEVRYSEGIEQAIALLENVG